MSDAHDLRLPELPVPPESARALSATLQTRIHEVIAAAGGQISFADYMQLALYSPGLGYYVNGLRKLGEGGDFVTAPELSALFGACLARQIAEVHTTVSGAEILEFGAGSAALAVDILLELERLNQLPERYLILDLSPDLQRRQRETLATRAAHLSERVTWVDTLPDGFQGTILANEVLDALPVERFCVQNGECFRYVVESSDGELTLSLDPADEALSTQVRSLPLPSGEAWSEAYTSELCPLLDPWLSACADTLRQGAILLIDYGYPRSVYYHPERSAGTLRCHYRQRAHDDPLFYPGLQDITAHVDFTSVAEVAQRNGLCHEGFTFQQQFLFNCGLAEMADQRMAEASTTGSLDLAHQVRQLVMPGAMGESFNVVGFSKQLEKPMSGFSSRDRSHLL